MTAGPGSELATHYGRTTNRREARTRPLGARIRVKAHRLETEGQPCGLTAREAELESKANDLGANRTGAPEAATKANEWPVAVH